MPNRVLLLFSVEKHSEGYFGWPKAVDPDLSDYDIASNVARKVFWTTIVQKGSDPSTIPTHQPHSKDASDDTDSLPFIQSAHPHNIQVKPDNQSGHLQPASIPDSLDILHNSWIDVVASFKSSHHTIASNTPYSNSDLRADIQRSFLGDSDDDALPCYAIIDVAFFVQSPKMPDNIDSILKPLLRRLSNASPPRPVILVSTIREFQLADTHRNELAHMIQRFVPLCRNDVDPWDELYNLIKILENSYRCQDILREAPESSREDELRIGRLRFHRRVSPEPLSTENSSPFSTHPIENESALILNPDTLTRPLILCGLKLTQLVISPSSNAPPRADFKRGICRQPILIWNCEIGVMRFYDTSFESSVIVRDSAFLGETQLRNCDFHGVLDFRNTRFSDDFDVEYCHFLQRMPWFRKTHFCYRFEFRRNMGPDSYRSGFAPTMMFERATFQARTRIDMPAQRTRLCFYACRFEQSDYTEINWLRFPGDEYAAVERYDDFCYWTTAHSIRSIFYTSLGISDDLPPVTHPDSEVPRTKIINTFRRSRRFYDRRHLCTGRHPADITNDIDIYLRMTSCSIDGRIVVREYPEYRRTFPYISRAGLMVILDASTITGSLNLSSVRLRSLSAIGTVFNNGGLQINRLQHHPSLWISLYPKISERLLWAISTAKRESFRAFVRKWTPWIRSVEFYADEADIVDDERSESLGSGSLSRRLSYRIVSLRRWFRVPPEFIGIVHDELVAAGRSVFRFADTWKFRSEILVPQKEVHENEKLSMKEGRFARRRYRERLYERIAQQYDDLRVAFRNTPDADENEDFCHYKAQQYHYAAMGSHIPNWVRHTTGILFIVFFLLSLDVVGALMEGQSWGIVSTLHVLLTASGVRISTPSSTPGITEYVFRCIRGDSLALFSYGYQDIVAISLLLLSSFLYLNYANFRNYWWTAMKHGFARQIYDGLLAYGVYPFRPLLSSFILIAFFAQAYWIIPVTAKGLAENGYIPSSWAGRGDILDSSDHSILGVSDNSSRFSTEPLQVLSDCLYFSVVTFTTLGYGDYHAIGSLRIIAMCEAMTGSLMIALITVAVARQILRS